MSATRAMRGWRRRRRREEEEEEECAEAQRSKGANHPPHNSHATRTSLQILSSLTTDPKDRGLQSVGFLRPSLFCFSIASSVIFFKLTYQVCHCSLPCKFY